MIATQMPRPARIEPARAIANDRDMISSAGLMGWCFKRMPFAAPAGEAPLCSAGLIFLSWSHDSPDLTEIQGTSVYCAAIWRRSAWELHVCKNLREIPNVVAALIEHELPQRSNQLGAVGTTVGQGKRR